MIESIDCVERWPTFFAGAVAGAGLLVAVIAFIGALIPVYRPRGFSKGPPMSSSFPPPPPNQRHGRRID